jgi:hypothetical protein
MKLPYNAILIEPFLHEINIVITTKYLAMKFPTYKRISTVKETKWYPNNATPFISWRRTHSTSRIRYNPKQEENFTNFPTSKRKTLSLIWPSFYIIWTFASMKQYWLHNRFWLCLTPSISLSSDTHISQYLLSSYHLFIFSIK